jgi:hypothetical protein
MDALRGSLSNAESFGRGFAVAPVGLLGDIEGLLRKGVNFSFGRGGVNVGETPVLPTTEGLLSSIPRMTAPRMETAGMEQIGSAANPRGPINLGRAVASLPSDVARAGREFMAAGQPARVVSPSIAREGNPIQSAVVLIGDKIFTGRTHGDALNRAVYEGAVRKEGGKYIYPKGAEVNSDLFMTNSGQIIDRLQASKMFDIGASETAIGKGLMQNKPPSSMTIDQYMEQAQAIKKQKEQPSFQYPQEQALRTAQENAATLGQSAKQETRMLQQGYYPDWYHGSTGDITNFRPDLLGEATGAASAKKAYFFARDPQNPPAGLLQKTTDQESIDLLKRLGKTDEEIAALNAVSMKGNAAQTASGYAQIGGSREYREAMRKANSAEKRGDWNEYEKQMQIAEDSEINRMNYAQGLVAKYGDARDEMLRAINENTIYNKKLPQAEQELLDAKYKELMPYGWYNTYEPKQFQELKKELVNLVGKESAAPALKKIDDFMSVKAERMILENTQEGGNVLPVALRYKNPMVYDFAGSSYRDQSYSDLIDKAIAGGHDALIMKNTYDPASGPSKLIDVGAVFSPDQIRSRFAAFDPFRKDVATATAMGVALPDLLASPVDQQRQQPSIEDLMNYGLLSP